MNEILTLSLKYLSDYLRTFINLVASPRKFPLSANLYDGEKFNQGLLFFGISLVVSLVIKTPFRPSGVDVWLYLAMDGVWKILFIFALTITMLLAWLGRPGAFREYFVANCYFGGVLFVLIPLLFVILEGATLVLPGLTEIGFLYFYGYALGLFLWCFGAWLSFGKHNSVELWETVLRLPIALILMLLIGTISIFVRGGTVIDAVAEAGGNDYASASSQFLLIPTFGLFP